MSSLRNAVKRITHKERSQPQARAHLGFLEKHQDYKKRADHYHKKEDRMQMMKRKASMRNPDEFYFGMHSAEINDDGKHQKTEEARRKELEDVIGYDAVRVMKSQDLAHVRMIKARDTKKAQKLKEALHFIGNNHSSSTSQSSSTTTKSKKAKHTIFVNSKEEAKNFDPAKHFDTAPELVERAFNRPRTSALKASALEQLGYSEEHEYDGEEEEETSTTTNGRQQTLSEEDLKWQNKMDRKAARKAAKARSNAYGEMEARIQRAAAMEKAEAFLVTEKLVSGKGRKRKIKGAENGQPAQYKWRRKRKK